MTDEKHILEIRVTRENVTPEEFREISSVHVGDYIDVGYPGTIVFARVVSEPTIVDGVARVQVRLDFNTRDLPLQ